MFFSKILAQPYTIKHYIMIENIFVVITFNFLVLHKTLEIHVNDCFGIHSIFQMDIIKMAKKDETVKFKKLYKKNKINIHYLC